MGRINQLLLLIVTAFAVGVNARNGLDFIQAVSVATMKCLKNDGINFIIPRVYTNLGYIDETGISNIKNAHAGGIPYVDGYIFPCVGSSRCASAATQVSTALNRIKAEGTYIGTLWLDIERLSWPADHATNRKFIEAMVAEANALKHAVGIYSNYYNWEAIVGLDYTGQSHLPLWWAEYDGTPGFAKYKEFGGWKQPNVHQWHGTEAGPCGVSVDLNYSP
ncbi:unnamed protein product [Caenorhabditis angaria]|uniref:Uncharacterized protein n=1 Tax=Caenorhabditis angaria TaxID=860376 RepID=A0A9P1MZK5_9PELO|nr:unnamed protein product [Caenorhabditis angaria]